MPKVSQEHLDARRRQILDAAIECFSEKGFHRATMHDIVQRSGLSAGAIYRYFESKEELIQAIADERHARELSLISAAASGADGLGENLHQLILNFFGRLEDADERRQRRIGIEIWAEALRNPAVYETVRDGIDEPRTRLAKLIREAQARGEVTPHLEPDAVARLMIAVFQGFLLQQAWDPSVEVKPYLSVLQWLLDGLVQRSDVDVHP